MGYSNPPISWSEFERALSTGRPGAPPVGADGGDSPAWSHKRMPYVPPPVTDPAEPHPRHPPAWSRWCHMRNCTPTPTSVFSTVHPRRNNCSRRPTRLGLTGLALTDHDGLYGIVHMAEAAESYDITTVFGAELSLGLRKPQNGEADPEGSHLLVLARGEEGYHRLAGALTAAQLAGKEKGGRSTTSVSCPPARAGTDRAHRMPKGRGCAALAGPAPGVAWQPGGHDRAAGNRSPRRPVRPGQRSRGTVRPRRPARQQLQRSAGRGRPKPAAARWLRPATSTTRPPISTGWLPRWLRCERAGASTNSTAGCPHPGAPTCAAGPRCWHGSGATRAQSRTTVEIADAHGFELRRARPGPAETGGASRPHPDELAAQAGLGWRGPNAIRT